MYGCQTDRKRMEREFSCEKKDVPKCFWEHTQFPLLQDSFWSAYSNATFGQIMSTTLHSEHFFVVLWDLKNESFCNSNRNNMSQNHILCRLRSIWLISLNICMDFPLKLPRIQMDWNLCQKMPTHTFRAIFFTNEMFVLGAFNCYAVMLCADPTESASAQFWWRFRRLPHIFHQ